MTELTDVGGLKHRTGLTEVRTTMPWRRVIGGKFGASINLPAGCYSDDTQLRLATCRSIRSDGEFDQHAFAKIELPTFLAYALGAGRGTKAAATNLGRADVKWSGNTYATKDLRYGDGGGNGAAMRVQPHVWVCPTLRDPAAVLVDVLRNSVITHGHPAALVGACWHALELAHALASGEVTEEAWRPSREVLKHLPDMVQSDEQLRLRWIPIWSEHTGRDLASELAGGVRELFRQLDALPSTLTNDRLGDYLKVLDAVGGFDAATRGSGTGTAVAASWLAAAGRESPVEALRLAANTLNSDTDTIATMAGALLGACDAGELPGELMDAPYISYEAVRLAAIATGERGTPNFGYPDLLHVSMPKAALDLIGTVDGQLALAGLGWLNPLDEAKPAGTGKSVFQFVSRRVEGSDLHGIQAGTARSDAPIELFGFPTVPEQTLLIKRREEPRELPAALLPVGLRPAGPLRPMKEASSEERRPKHGIATDQQGQIRESRRGEQIAIDGIEEAQSMQAAGSTLGQRDDRRSTLRHRKVSAEEALDWCAREGYNADVVGRAVLALLEQEHGTSLAAAFVAMLAARRA